ncbi:MAG TPA: 2-amino-4-hydroxy-6-hydroxymethyldihydropteridine diphosphokinase [Nevskiaceae bacterium]|nr:2-amino-4-hydroxy-6-hydroxymethyldihydropteridine diphosphokinase [Nevskiaceae bacterium]
MAQAFIALGANLGDPHAQVRAALERIRALPGVTLLATSRFYRSAPIGPPGQPFYCNAVCSIRTGWPPAMLLGALQGIEDAAGRKRDGERWGPRSLDLDLLMYDALELDTPSLTLPHPQMHLRNFVLAPLAEIAPGLTVPGRGNVIELLAAAGNGGLTLWPGSI